MALLDDLKSFANDLEPIAKTTPAGFIAVDLIDRDDDQPRVEFDADKLEELAASIREIGILEPVLLRANGERYTLIAGERRFRAAKIAGLTEIPAMVREDMEDAKRRLVAQIAENVQRAELTDLELGKSFLRMKNELRMTQREISKMLGLSDSAVGRFIAAANPENEGDLGLCGGSAITLERFRSLPDEVKDVLREQGGQVGVPDILKLSKAVKAGGEITADNLADVLSGSAVVEPVTKPASTPSVKVEKPSAPVTPPVITGDEDQYMSRIEDAGEDIEPASIYGGSGDDDDEALFGGVEIDETQAPAIPMPAASTYKGDTGLDGVSSDFKDPADASVGDTLLSVSIKIPVSRARVLLKLLGGDEDMYFADIPSALSDLLAKG